MYVNVIYLRMQTIYFEENLNLGLEHFTLLPYEQPDSASTMQHVHKTEQLHDRYVRTCCAHVQNKLERKTL